MPDYFEVITDIKTGEKTIRPYTPEEIEAHLAKNRPPVPSSITRRQCAKQLFIMGLINGDEAVAMTRNGTPPAIVAIELATLADAERTIAEIDFAADTYLINNPLLLSLMEKLNKTQADLDEFFIAAAAL